MQSKLTLPAAPPPKKNNRDVVGVYQPLICLWIHVRYINGDTVTVGNDLKIGDMGEATKDILPRFPMPFYSPPPPTRFPPITVD